MQRLKSLLALLVALAIALAPCVADARAGSGASLGSRGSMTFSPPPVTSTAPNVASPMQRTLTQPSPGVGAGPSGGFAPRPAFGSGLMGGMMGGLLGAGLFGLLIGHGFFGHGLGMFGFLGLMLQIFLLVALVRFLLRMFAGGGMAVAAQGPSGYARQGMPSQGPMPGGGRGGPPPIAIGPADYQQFEQLLYGIQAAWSQQDLNGLHAMCTPEMLSYFNEQLSDQSSRGVRNIVSNVRLESGDLAQAWTEQGRDYATVAMRFSMTDVTQDFAGHVVDGSATEHVSATEVWTFVRAHGGHWVLSAIQQTG